jgi:hypothetical protein
MLTLPTVLCGSETRTIRTKDIESSGYLNEIYKTAPKKACRVNVKEDY